MSVGDAVRDKAAAAKDSATSAALGGKEFVVEKAADVKAVVGDSAAAAKHSVGDSSAAAGTWMREKVRTKQRVCSSSLFASHSFSALSAVVSIWDHFLCSACAVGFDCKGHGHNHGPGRHPRRTRQGAQR